MIQGLSSDFVKYPSWRSNSVTHTMLPVSGTQRHRFLILPGITDEGQFVYDTLLALREKSKYKQSSLDSYRESQWCEPPEVDTWWDEEVKKGTEWYKEYCKVTGFVSISCLASLIKFICCAYNTQIVQANPSGQ